MQSARVHRFVLVASAVLTACQGSEVAPDLRSFGYEVYFGACWYTTKGPIDLDQETEHGTPRTLGEAAAGAWRIRPAWWESGDARRPPAGAWDELEVRLELDPEGEVTLYGGPGASSDCAQTVVVVPLRVGLRSADGAVQGASGGGTLAVWGGDPWEQVVNASSELGAWPEGLEDLADVEGSFEWEGFHVQLYNVIAGDGSISVGALYEVEGQDGVGTTEVYAGAWAGREVAP